MPGSRVKVPAQADHHPASARRYRRALLQQSEYEALQSRIDHWRSIERISAETGYDPEMLLILYTQRVTRAATKRFYKVKSQARQLVTAWKGGESLLQIAQRVDFPPILTAYQLLMEDRVPRKRFWAYIRDPATIPDRRLRKEVEELLEEDLIYSPEGTDIQHARGKVGEGRLNEWLDRHGISYLTENDLRGEHTKTPDVLLHEPLVVDNLEIHWIESKANFGDRVEIRRNLTKQLAPYLSLFGSGLVIYWFGYVYDQPLPEGILISDETLLLQDDLHSLVSHPVGGPPRRTPAKEDDNHRALRGRTRPLPRHRDSDRHAHRTPHRTRATPTHEVAETKVAHATTRVRSAAPKGGRATSRGKHAGGPAKKATTRKPSVHPVSRGRRKPRKDEDA